MATNNLLKHKVAAGPTGPAARHFMRVLTPADPRLSPAARSRPLQFSEPEQHDDQQHDHQQGHYSSSLIYPCSVGRAFQALPAPGGVPLFRSLQRSPFRILPSRRAPYKLCATAEGSLLSGRCH